MMENNKKEEIKRQIQYGEELIDGLNDTRDHLKHMNTLNTGSILITIAFLAKVFECPKGMWIVAISIMAFVISLLCSLYAMNNAINIRMLMSTIKNMALSENWEEFKIADEILNKKLKRGKFGERAANIGFFIGITTLVIFAMFNFL